jgi:hypothetical protein
MSMRAVLMCTVLVYEIRMTVRRSSQHKDGHTDGKQWCHKCAALKTSGSGDSHSFAGYGVTDSVGGRSKKLLCSKINMIFSEYITPFPW